MSIYRQEVEKTTVNNSDDEPLAPGEVMYWFSLPVECKREAYEYAISLLARSITHE